LKRRLRSIGALGRRLWRIATAPAVRPFWQALVYVAIIVLTVLLVPDEPAKFIYTEF
jgi:hypothetical protein